MRLFLIAAIPLALILYGHALEAPYYLDDGNVLEGAANYSPNLGGRTVAYASFYLNTLAIDAVGPLFHWKPSFYYRLVNLLIHVLASAVLLGLVRELTGRVSTAYAVGFLFLVHPLTSEPVMYVSQRFQSLATLWIFVAGWSYARFRKSGDWISGDRRWLLVTLVASAAALFTKPFAYVLPLWILVLEFTYFSKLKWNWRYLYFIPVGEILLWKLLLYLSPRNASVFDAAPWDPRRSPKTGQWWSPENRPTNIDKPGTLTPTGSRNRLRRHEQCLEHRKERASCCIGAAWMAAASDRTDHRRAS